MQHTHPLSSYTNNIPRLDNIEIAKFADDTALLATGWDPHMSVRKLQAAAKWTVNVIKPKPIQVNFTKKNLVDPLPLDNNGISLYMTLHAKL